MSRANLENANASCFKDDPSAGLRQRVSGFVQNITAGPVMSGEADVELVTVDPDTAEKAEQLVFDDPPNHIRSQSSPSATSHDRPSIPLLLFGSTQHDQPMPECDNLSLHHSVGSNGTAQETQHH